MEGVEKQRGRVNHHVVGTTEERRHRKYLRRTNRRRTGRRRKNRRGTDRHGATTGGHRHRPYCGYRRVVAIS